MTRGQRSFVDVVQRRASLQGERIAYTFLAEGESEAGSTTYAELERRARAYAVFLRSAGVAGGRILLLLPAGIDFVIAFYGCSFAGSVAVPAYPPQSRRMLPRLRAILESSEPAAVLTTQAILRRVREHFQEELNAEAQLWLAVEDIDLSLADGWQDPQLGPDSLALLQYTSGSTASPKGVIVTQGNLIHNQEVIQHACAHDETSRFVTWLPLYHDLGLIGNVLQSAFVGGQCVMMAPVAFLQRPRRWLEAVTRYRATTSGGPDFAFDLCVQRVPPAERDGLDLESWRVAFSGSEPVRARTLERFVAAFAGCNFRGSALYPCYGLAEATLMVSGGMRAAGPLVRGFAPRALAEGEVSESCAATTETAASTAKLVGCGRPLPGQEVRIVDPDTGEPCPADRQGEVWVRGASVAQGYWKLPELSAEIFGARLAGTGEGPYLRTGDLGFLFEGELFLSGRLKDLIIVRGRNLYPQDIEIAVRESHPGLASGFGAAFAVEENGAERLVVVHEIETRKGLDLDAVAGAARSAVAELYEVPIHQLVLIRAGTLPRTSSGKVQRRACREQLSTGDLAVVARSLLAEEGAAPSSLAVSRVTLLAIGPDERRALAEEAVRILLGSALRRSLSALPPDQPLSSEGLDSLAAMEIVDLLESRFGVALTASELIEKGTLAGCVDRILAATEEPVGSLPPPVPGGEAFPATSPAPLSAGQQGLWFLCRLDPGSPAYNVCGAFAVSSPLDFAALEKACVDLVDRHASLRTVFGERDGVPFQEARARGAVVLERLAFDSWRDGLPGRYREVRRRLTEEALRPFDLGAGPPIRVALAEGAGDEQVLLVVVHHIVCDFGSLAVLLEELERLYGEHAGGPAATLPPLADGKGDFARHQREMLAGAAGEESWRYWREQLAGELPRLDLPYDRAPTTEPDAVGNLIASRLGPARAARLQGLAAERRATLFMVLLAGFEALLQRCCGQRDLLVGVPTAGRAPRAMERQVGYFVNPLVLRADLSGDPSGAELVARVAATTCGGLAYQHFPYTVLVERLGGAAHPRQSPLLQAAFTLYRSPQTSSLLPAAIALGLPDLRVSWCGREVSPFPLAAGPAPFELTLVAAALEDDLGISLQGRRDLFDRSTMVRLARHLEVLLGDLAEFPARRLSELSLLSAAERHQLMWVWSSAAVPAAGADVAADEWVARQAELRPEGMAIVWGAGEELTYGALDQQADGLADQLRGLGIGPESRVALLLERSPELVVAALAVLRSGGAYLPLDRSHPAERLSWQLADSGVELVLTGSSAVAEVSSWTAKRVLAVEDLVAAVPAGERVAHPRRSPLPESLAYGIYTSGSTGTPKLVGLAHRGLSNLVAWHRSTHGLDSSSRTTLIAGVGFDASVWELWSALSSGAALYIPPLEIAGSPDRLVEWLGRCGITHSFLPTPLAEAVLGEPGSVDLDLRALLTGGDRLHRRRGSGHRFALFNHYGPTESSVVATWGEVGRGIGRVPSIGRPIAGATAYVVDGEGRPSAIGVVGEIWLGGRSLARGYVGRPELTAERFIPDPFAGSGARLYRTGDLGRWLPDGRLDFLGRLDRQVKLRGFRIELEEIEARLLAQPGVRAAAVVLRAEGRVGEGLAAYWVASGEPARTSADLRQALLARLPEAMVPQWLVELSSLPLTANGKIDRGALPAPPRLEPVGESPGPSTPLAEVVASIWCEVLGLERVGADAGFFELGGHSLLATQVASRLRQALGVELPLRVLFERPTLAALVAEIGVLVRGGRTPSHALPALQARPSAEVPPRLSFAQERLWFLHQLEPDSSLYSIPISVRLRGPLDVAALQAAFEEVVRRHEVLRTRFEIRAGLPVQRIDSSGRCVWVRVDLAALGAPPIATEGRRLWSEAVRRPFDLARDPLLRVLLLRTGEGEHRLLINVHHIVSDGWSTAVLARELTALYDAARRRRPSPLADLPVQYADFAEWQRLWLRGALLDEQLAFWRDHLAGAPGLLELPLDHPRPELSSSRGESFSTALAAPLSSALRQLSRRSAGSLFMTLSAAFRALLWRLTGQADLVLGSPIANRGSRETEPLIGLFVNLLALRTRLAADRPWAELLASVRQGLLAAYANADLPFERLVEELQPARTMGHAPLVQVVLALESQALQLPALSGLQVELDELASATAKFDLSLSAFDAEESVAFRYEYRRDLFDRSTMVRLARHLEVLLGDLAEFPARRLSELSLLSAAERHQLMWVWSSAAVPAAGADVAADEWVARQAELRPEGMAIVWGAGEELTYGALDQQADGLADQLRGLGIGPESRVALLLERSPELVVAALAVLRSGGAYLPLDRSHPAERLSWQLADSGVELVLTGSSAVAEVSSWTAKRVLAVEDLVAAVPAGERVAHPRRSPLPESLAYGIYTSGSTGTPKLVGLAHRGLSNLVAWHRSTHGLDSSSRTTLIAGVGFDASVWELWSALSSGAALYIPPLEIAGSPDRLVEWLGRCGITHSFLPTPLAEAVLGEPGSVDLDLRALLTGGDRLHRRRGSGHRFALFNHYGPTESSVVATWGEVGRGIGRVPSIGRPIAGATAYVVDGEGRPSAIGVVGEIWLGGRSLARGYVGRPELTAERFIPDPFAGSGARLYRTGDLGRWLPDGRLDFLGRLDRQVKLRGFRIELEEIEARLLAQPGVRAAAVVLRAEGRVGEGLAAYWVASGEPARTSADLRQALLARLPEAMVPQWLVELSSLPLTANGKIDRGALPAPPRLEPVGESPGPSTPLAEVVASIWCEVLGLERVGADAGFFELGGHSLLATQVVSRLRQALGVELPLRVLFERPTLAALVAEIGVLVRGGVHGLAAPPIRPAPRAGALPLSHAQRRLWFIDQLEPGSPAYNLAAAYRVIGPLDRSALRRSFRELICRHEILRTTFDRGQDGPIQRIGSPWQVVLPHIDLSRLGDAEREVSRLVEEEARCPFDLARGPLLRARLIRLAPGEHVVLFNLHHIVGDGWSAGVLVRELAALYEAFRQGRASPLPALALQYADFAIWQREWLSGPVLEAEFAYWRERLAGAPELLALPTDRPRPPVQSFRGSSVPIRLPVAAEMILQTCRRASVTPFMLLLGAFEALLWRSTGEVDLSLGMPIAGRNRIETESLLGFFVNTLVLRCDLAGDPTFTELLDQVRRVVLEAHAHQELPFEMLVEALQPKRSLSYEPLFQVVVDFHNRLPGPSREFSDLAWSSLAIDQQFVHFDLILTGEEELGGRMEYRADLFDRATIQRMVGHLQILLAGALQEDGRALSALPLLTAGEQQQLLGEWGERRRFPADCLQSHFSAQVLRRPMAPAVIAGVTELSYRDLDRQAELLARRLQRHGVGPEVIVAIFLERSPQLVVAVLAVLKAGGAYLPLDPHSPPERLEFMLRDSGTRLLLTESGLAGTLPVTGAQLVLIEAPGLAAEDPGPVVSTVCADNLAYVIYTSGSTGQPRAVQVSHRNVSRLLAATEGLFGFSDEDVWTLFHSYAFDFSVWEMWGALAYGGRLIVVSYWVSRAPESFYQLLVDEGVTVLNQTPSSFRQLIAADRQADEALRQGLALRLVVFGGEALELASLAPWVEHHGVERPRLVNMYGITETTVHVTWRPIALSDLDHATGSVIGPPLPDLTLRLLGPRMELQPIGAPGELCVAGEGLARGYLGQPERTAEKFVPDPWPARPGARLYRSGDLGRRLPNADIEYLGRIDHQVKIRGFRIELGEIEAALAACPGVQECVVVARQAPSLDTQLVAYVVAAPSERPVAASLRELLKRSLPDYMLPSAYVLLPALPLTGNGKVDRAALPAPDGERAAGAAEAEQVSPRNPIEGVLVEIWQEVLGRERVGVRDDFFALGGHSLLATQVVSRLRGAFRVELPVRCLFEAPTVAELAEVIEARLFAPGDSESPPLLPGSGSLRLPAGISQRRLWLIEQVDPEAIPFNLPVAVRLTGELDVPRLENSLESIVGRQEALRSTFADVEGELLLAIGPPFPIAVPIADLGGLPVVARAAEAHRLAVAEARRGMSLATGPLLRALLLRCDAREHQALFTFHHLIADGWSLGVLLRELAAFYRAAAGRGPAGLPALPLQYRDYLEWQRRWLASAAFATELAYWRAKLADASPALDFPTDRPRPLRPSFRGAQRRTALDPELLRALKQLGRAQGGTLFLLLLAGFTSLLRRYSDQRDMVVGTPIAGRGHRKCEDLIGLFLNTLALRVDTGERTTFRELLAQVRETALEAYAHQQVPFENIVEDLKPARDLGRSPIFQTMLVLQNAPLGSGDLGGVRLDPLDVDIGVERLDLELIGAERGQELLLALQYSTHLFDGATMARALLHLENLLRAAVADPDCAVDLLPMLGAAERHQLAIEWLPPGKEPPDRPVYEMFAAWAAKDPAAPALSCDGAQLSYGELAQASRRLADRLLEATVGRRGPVALLVNSGALQVVSMLAALAAGCGFLCLDSNYPPERLRAVLDLAGAIALITEPECLAEHEGWIRVWQEQAARPVVLGAAPAEIPAPKAGAWTADRSPVDLDAHVYTVFTSGSTGTPKGIVQSHRSFAQFLRWQERHFDIGPGRRIAHWASVTYDAAYCEILGVLCCGATLCTTAQSTRFDPARLLVWLAQEKVTLFQTVPSFFRQLLAQAQGGEECAAAFSSLRWVLLAGEALPPDLAAAALAALPDGCRLFNLYGPSEAILASWYEVRRDALRPDFVPIGSPIEGRELSVVDRQGQVCPIGVRGEIEIRSRYLSSGYLDPDASRTAFLACSLAMGGTGALYRTGDLARWLGDGTLRFDGRRDGQIKLHGVRVELEEIERVVGRHPEVRECAASVRRLEQGGQQLLVWLCLWDSQTSAPGPGPLIDELRELARRSLPPALIPSAFVSLPELPRTRTGKLDREALSRLSVDAPSGEREYRAPTSSVEREVAAIWQDLLKIPRIGVDDNFFEIGGHSLLATRLLNHLRRDLGVELPLRCLFECPTVAALSVRVEELRRREKGTDLRIAALLDRVSALSPDEVAALLRQRQQRTRNQQDPRREV